MKKKVLMMVLAAVLSMSMLAGCVPKQEKEPEAKAETTEETEPEETEEETEEEEPEEEEVEEEPKTTEPAEKPAELGDKWVDFDNRSFAVNGKVYTLGENTLQDMIDDGVPFDEDDIANAGNNLNSNTESQNFEIVLGEYYGPTVRVANLSDSNMKIADCKLSSIRLTIDLEKDSGALQFAFPLTMTKDEMLAELANLGEPTYTDNYTLDNGDEIAEYQYTINSEKYLADSGYIFKFHNGKLDTVEMDWIE